MFAEPASMHAMFTVCGTIHDEVLHTSPSAPTTTARPREHRPRRLASRRPWGTWMLGGPFSGYWTEHRASKTHSNPTCYNPAQCACEGKILRQRNDTRTLRASVQSWIELD